MIDLDALLELFAETGAMVIDIYHVFDITINGHTYSGFLALIAILAFYWVTCFIWGNDDDS